MDEVSEIRMELVTQMARLMELDANAPVMIDAAFRMASRLIRSREDEKPQAAVISAPGYH